MGNALSDAVDRCRGVENCGVCAGTGNCCECGGSGHVTIAERENTRTITQKGRDGFALAISKIEIEMLPEEQRVCVRCGGWGNDKGEFKGANSVRRRNSPRNFYEPHNDPLTPPKSSSPTRERPGDGKCRRCKGAGKVPREPQPASPSRGGVTRTQPDLSYRKEAAGTRRVPPPPPPGGPAPPPQRERVML